MTIGTFEGIHLSLLIQTFKVIYKKSGSLHPVTDGNRHRDPLPDTGASLGNPAEEGEEGLLEPEG